MPDFGRLAIVYDKLPIAYRSSAKCLLIGYDIYIINSSADNNEGGKMELVGFLGGCAYDGAMIEVKTNGEIFQVMAERYGRQMEYTDQCGVERKVGIKIFSAEQFESFKKTCYANGLLAELDAKIVINALLLLGYNP